MGCNAAAFVDAMANDPAMNAVLQLRTEKDLSSLSIGVIPDGLAIRSFGVSHCSKWTMTASGEPGENRQAATPKAIPEPDRHAVSFRLAKSYLHRAVIGHDALGKGWQSMGIRTVRSATESEWFSFESPPRRTGLVAKSIRRRIGRVRNQRCHTGTFNLRLLCRVRGAERRKPDKVRASGHA